MKSQIFQKELRTPEMINIKLNIEDYVFLIYIKYM